MNHKKYAAYAVVFVVLAVLVYLQFRTWRDFDWARLFQYRLNWRHILHGIGYIYLAYFLRALRTEEALHGNDSMILVPLVGELSYLYDGWGKPDKAEPYYHQAVTIIEKQYGDSSPVLESLLTKDAAELRTLGKSDEADALDKRLATIRAATMKTN